jgi:multidrug efflux pump subunit AcrA (membrane-fusion protein)
MKKLLTLLIVAGMAALGWSYHKKWFGVGQPARTTASGNPPIAAAVVRDAEHSVQVSGEVWAAAQFAVKTEVTGRIKKLHVAPGEQVKAGDLLVEIDELSSREAYDDVIAKLAPRNDLSRADLQLVEDKLSGTKVRAPRDGIVVTMPVSEGQGVVPASISNSGTTLLTIGDISTFIVQTHVSLADIAKFAVQQTAQITADAIPGEQMEAVISRIAPFTTLVNSVKGFSVRAVIERPSAQLRPGMTVRLTVPITAHKKSR